MSKPHRVGLGTEELQDIEKSLSGSMIESLQGFRDRIRASLEFESRESQSSITE